MFKKYIIITLLIILCIVLSSGCSDQQSTKDGLILTLLNPELTKASKDFYSEYLTTTPLVASYQSEIIDIKKEDKGYYIKIGNYPFIGPHYNVGYDEAEFFINNLGVIILLNFSHKKNIDITERYQDKIIKPIPIS